MAAAGYVFLEHVADARGWSQHIGVVFRFGQEAVMIFFILSGFVIFANERARALSPRGYVWRRFRRIYPPLLLSMLLSTAVALDNGDFRQTFTWTSLLGTLASVQDISKLKPGVITDPYLGNDPLWSLSYEMAFYIAFPFVLRAWVARPRLASAGVGAGCCAAYVLFAVWPNHFALVAAYFLIWWAGAMAADAYFRGAADLRGFLPTLGWLALLCAVAAGVVKAVGYRGLGYYPFLPLRHFVFALTMLVALATPLGAALASRCLIVARPAAYVASLSYGIYVLHYPVIRLSKRVASGPAFCVAVIALFVLAWFADRWLNRRLSRRGGGSRRGNADAARTPPVRARDEALVRSTCPTP